MCGIILDIILDYDEEIIEKNCQRKGRISFSLGAEKSFQMSLEAEASAPKT
jgi:hypothetical protein